MFAQDRTAKSWRARDKRQGRIFVATMRCAYSVNQSIIVRNLSPQGLGARAKIQCPGRGEIVAITLPMMPERYARVKWIRGDQFGVRFVEPLSNELFQSLTARMQQSVSPEYHG
jgi:hypothetical protein